VNPEDAVLGSAGDADPALRLRRERELATVGSTTVRALTSALSQAFKDSLQGLIVFENDTDLVDADGRPPHSVEALLYDGDIPVIANDAIAQVLYDNKAGGIPTSGNQTGNAKALINGVETTKPVPFSRTTLVSIYLDFTITRLASYVGDAALKDYVATQANKIHGPGGEVIALVVRAMPLALLGVKDVVSMRLGFAPAPVGVVNLPIGVRELARFDTSRITVG
jgi:hypothetical protein